MAKKILIVDDEQMITKLLRKRLEAQGYDCDECWDGGSALEMAKEGAFDIILMDYSMPSMKGDEFCQSAREEEKLKSIPIIMLTAYTTRSVESFKEEGATDVMYKPIDEDDLQDLIKKYVGE